MSQLVPVTVKIRNAPSPWLTSPVPAESMGLLRTRARFVDQVSRRSSIVLLRRCAKLSSEGSGLGFRARLAEAVWGFGVAGNAPGRRHS